MSNFSFDTGLATFTVNGNCEIKFNPTDSAFATKIANAFDQIENVGKKFREKVATAKEKDIFALCEKRDAEARKIIDAVFDAPVCNSLFGDMSVFALANGLPVWCNLFFAVMDEMDVSVIEERKKTNPRIAEYTAKYRRNK